MFGYVTINRCELKVRELEVYQSYYCGLCRVLKDRYGLTGCTTLNYDMTFLGLLLSGLHELEETPKKRVCRRRDPYCKSAVYTEALAYAADMNYMLAYHSHMDHWLDEGRFLSLNMVHIMRRNYVQLTKQYPRQSQAIENYVRKLRRLEKKGDMQIEAAANLTGEAMAEIYDWKQDTWSSQLRTMGYYMGKFIYLMDAYDDVEADIKKKNYNPLKELSRQPDFEEKIREYLELIMSCCCRAFETLPILENAQLMRNILYAGVWTKYASIHNISEGVSNFKRAER